MSELEIIRKFYDGDSICDIYRDVSEAIDGNLNKDIRKIPCDKYGLQEGTFLLTIVWHPNHELSKHL